MKEETQRVIERYLELVQVESVEEVDQGELQAIARELGVSEEEIQAADTAAEAHAKRARLHLQHSLHDDALREFGAAAALRPFDPEIRRGLSETLVDRWEAHGERSDADIARTLVLRSIEESPEDHASYALLKRLERAPHRSRTPIALFLALVIALGGTTSWFFLSPNPEEQSASPQSRTSKVVAAPSPSRALSARASGDVAVEFEEQGKLKGFTFKATRSRFERYDGGALSYKLQAELRNDSAYALELLTLKYALIAEDGSVLESVIKKTLKADEPVHRPGDLLAWSHLFFDKDAGVSGPLPKTLKITLSDVVTQPKAEYAEAPLIPLAWAVDKGPFELEFRQRHFRASERPLEFGSDKGKTFHELILEVRNQAQTLKGLKVRATWRDATGAALGTTERFVIGPLAPPLANQQSRLYRLIGMVEGKASNATLEVSAAD